MKNFDKKIKEFENSNPFSLFYEFGASPEEIKINIIQTFSEYFYNKNNLEQLAIKDLVPTWLVYLNIQKDFPELINFIKPILDIFNDAKKINEIATIKAYIDWYADLNQSLSRSWSIYNIQHNFSELCIEDFLEVMLSNMGKSIEGLSKPFLKLLLHLNKIKRHKSVNLNDIQSKDLGVVIDELINTSDLKDLLILDPNSIRLNQWRNIAYHHNTKIISGEIICSLKRNNIINEFSITRDQLLEVSKKIYSIFNLIRIAETIFCIDNFALIQKNIVNVSKSQLNYREEARLSDFYLPITSQGFSIIRLEYNQSIAVMNIRDMDEYNDFTKRAIHTSQFLYNLWLLTQSSKLQINYFLFSGEKFFTSEIDASSFLKTMNKSNISRLLKHVNFKYISQEYTQNQDPFENMFLSEKIIKHPQKFASQLGEPISVEEFVKQFSLSVFCNYLVAKSEGFEEIKLNVGSDGSLIIAEKPRNLILPVPASIINKDLQIKIIEIISQLIEFYESKVLKYEIVLQTKKNNSFFHKKAIIRQHPCLIDNIK
ncbi:hypothetical protein [Chryseobacterium indologenes]|uniref:hypothetical protein n=1 Tax=Chryseobacterium indologenes TaxID=253 RepID=UPI001629E04C|nr:hypothetical protein [Chryseobacterium indologenes]